MPDLRNILVNPRAVVRWPVNADRQGTAEVYVAGLLCNVVCARRVGGALRCLPGVTEVAFHPEEDTFIVSFAGKPLDEGTFHDAVARRVLFRGVRRWLERLAKVHPRLQRRT